uniref:Phospholipid scramblase n=1 Tax=Globodera pallida TaxID=36090 RepID=A0A183CRU6_GLOPA
MSSAVSVQVTGPKPQLCTLVKDSPFEEFGFSAIVEKDRGHFIDTVDKSGIADCGGLNQDSELSAVMAFCCPLAVLIRQCSYNKMGVPEHIRDAVCRVNTRQLQRMVDVHPPYAADVPSTGENGLSNLA